MEASEEVQNSTCVCDYRDQFTPNYSMTVEDSRAPFLGKIARNGNKLPLTYISWTDIPLVKLDEIWAEIQATTTAPPAYKSNCLKSLDEKWRGWKSRVKKKFLKFESIEDALANVPEDVDPEQWKILIQYWSLESVREVAERNRRNREFHGPPHRTGRTSFSVILEEMKKGKDTDELSVYIETRTDQNGVTKDDDATRLIGAMQEKLSSLPPSEQTQEARQRIFKECMGVECHGYARTMWLGPTPSQLSSGTTFQPSDEFMARIWSQVEEFCTEKFGGIIAELQLKVDTLTA